LKFLV